MFKSLGHSKRHPFRSYHDVLGDCSVVSRRTPGPTTGHAAFLVHLPQNGPIFFTGDLWYTCRCRTTRNIPSNNTDRAQTYESMARIEDLARELGARIVIQHERADWESMPRYPEYLQKWAERTDRKSTRLNSSH